jgi:hypothetical protein
MRWLISDSRAFAASSSFAPAADEVGVVEPREALLLRREARLLRRLVDRLDAAEQRLVLCDAVGERGQARRHLALHGLELRRVHARAPDAVDRSARASNVLPARSSSARVFSKVGGAGFAAMRDPVDLGQVLRHRRLEGRLEVGHRATRSNGGTPPYGPVHSARSGLVAAAAWCAAAGCWAEGCRAAGCASFTAGAVAQPAKAATRASAPAMLVRVARVGLISPHWQKSRPRGGRHGRITWAGRSSRLVR